MDAAFSDEQVAARLLDYLRNTLLRPALEYRERPSRIPQGVENRVYAFRVSGAEELSQPLILRLSSSREDPGRAGKEYSLQNALADAGYPAARVLFCGVDPSVLGGLFIVMERLPGRVAYDATIGISNMIQTWIETSVTGPGKVASVQAALHRLDYRTIVRAMALSEFPGELPGVAARLDEIRRRAETARLEGLRSGIDFMRSRCPGDGRLVICHGDLWIGNIMTDRGSVSGVIDWSMATLAPPEFDVAITFVGLLRGVPDISPVLLPLVKVVQFDAAHRYLRAYRRLAPLNRDLFLYFAAMRCLDVCSWVGERRMGIDGVIRADSAGGNIWDLPGSAEGFASYFKRITGVGLELPPRLIEHMY